MITGKDIYNVLAAVAPLYVAMALAYGSVKRWKIFTPDQCAGINRFVAVFAVPLLSFQFISTNNLYAMNYRFLAADALQKVVILVVLFLVEAITKHVGLEWIISFFSLATLPNTLVMGIPLLKGMYGEFTASLMVQIVVLQSVIWYTLMLFMFEYRGAMILIAEQFPETAGAISSITVDSDVVSLSGRDPLQADAVIGDDGRLHVSLRRLISSSPSLSSFNKAHTLNSITPRASNLTGVEIFSVHSSKEPTPRGSNFNQTDDQAVFPSPKHGLVNSFQKALGDYYGSTQSSRISTPRDSFHFEEENLKICQKNVPGSLHYHQHHLPGAASRSLRKNKELHMFVWSSAASSSMSDGHQSHSVNGNTAAFAEIEVAESAKSLRHESEKAADEAHGSSKKNQMPPATVMTRLILIMVWRKLITNPNTYASVFGLVWSLISFRWNVQMPSIVKGSISILSDTGLGMAMFSLGLFMALQPKIIACGKTVASLAMAVRFLIGPAVIAGTSFAVGLRGPLLHVSIIQAALPQGIVPFVFAKEYNVHAYVLSTAVIFGMLVALPITLIYYVLLEL